MVDAAFSQKGMKAISDISIIEFFSAFAKKVRTGEISKDDFQVTKYQRPASIPNKEIKSS